MNPKVFFHSNIPSLIGEMKQREGVKRRVTLNQTSDSIPPGLPLRPRREFYLILILHFRVAGCSFQVAAETYAGGGI